MVEPSLTALARKWARNFFTVCPPPDSKWFVEEALIPLLTEHIADAVVAALEGVENSHKQRSLLYNEALTLLLECDHGDEKTCGCRDSAMERVVAIAALREGRDA